MTMRRTRYTSNNARFDHRRACLRLALGLVMLTTLFVRHGLAQGQMPETIAYQGYLTNTDGDPANGATSVIFSLYDDDADGARVWQETQQGVVFTEGIFSVQLGSVESLDEVSFDQPLWLDVEVVVSGGGRVALRPRVPFSAVPYAMSVRGLRVEPALDPQQGFTLNVIGGHPNNEVGDDIFGATIGGGGVENFHNRVDGDLGTISGGGGNTIMGDFATIGGGERNEAAGFATIGGGSNNEAGDSATVGGGVANSASGIVATVGGGNINGASGDFTTVGGGLGNRAVGSSATVAGGNFNTAAGSNATVGGGSNNEAAGPFSTVVGGGFNSANGEYSFAAGSKARADHDGSFVWAGYFDLQDPPFASTAPRQFLIQAAGGVGIGTDAPRGALHVAETALDVDPNGFSTEALVVEGSQPVIGVYAAFQANTRPGLVLAGVDGGNVVDKWAIVREFFSGNALHFTYGLNEDHTQNATLMTLSNAGGGSSLSVPDGIVSTGQLRATNTLGASATPFQGSVYQDNMVYAWAHVQSDGSVSASYGCTVSQSATGSYTVTFKRQLPNGASAIVTPQTLNDPVIATAVASANQASVVTKVFNGTVFVPFNSGFYIQVVGRP